MANELLQRRNMMLRSGGIDWETIARGMLDFTTPFEIPESAGLLAAVYVCYGKSNLTSVEIPSGRTSIGQNAFYNCTALSNVSIPNTVTSIGNSCFYGCRALVNITLPSSVTSIGQGAFGDCRALKSINIPSGVTSLTQVFYDCRALPTITLPSTITSIGANTFGNCPGLTEMIFEGTTPPTLGGDTSSLGSTSYTFPIYVPDSAVDTYKAASSWSNYASRVKGISERPSE